MELADRLVVKEAETDAERRKLGTEAAVLDVVAHPGVVRLAGLEGDGSPDWPDRIILHRVAGASLETVGPQPARVVAAWAAAVATVLADMHDLGYSHGSVCAEHVILDSHGRPVLCGFGSAGPLGRGPVADVAALAELILARLPLGETGLRRLVAAWSRGGRRRRSGARGLAAALVRRVPDATMAAPGETPEPGPTRLRSPTVSVRWALGVAVMLVAAGALFLAGIHHETRDRPPADRTAAPPGAYLIEPAAGQNALTVLGRWGCGAARPAVLDLRSGSVWVFARWPAPGQSLAPRLVGRVGGATGLAVASAGSAGSACDALVVLRSSGADVRLPLPEGA